MNNESRINTFRRAGQNLKRTNVNLEVSESFSRVWRFVNISDE